MNCEQSTGLLVAGTIVCIFTIFMQLHVRIGDLSSMHADSDSQNLQVLQQLSGLQLSGL